MHNVSADCMQPWLAPIFILISFVLFQDTDYWYAHIEKVVSLILHRIVVLIIMLSHWRLHITVPALVGWIFSDIYSTINNTWFFQTYTSKYNENIKSKYVNLYLTPFKILEMFIWHKMYATHIIKTVDQYQYISTQHYNDVTMSKIASQITSHTIVHSNVY